MTSEAFCFLAIGAETKPIPHLCCLCRSRCSGIGKDHTRVVEPSALRALHLVCYTDVMQGNLKGWRIAATQKIDGMEKRVFWHPTKRWGPRKDAFLFVERDGACRELERMAAWDFSRQQVFNLEIWPAYFRSADLKRIATALETIARNLDGRVDE